MNLISSIQKKKGALMYDEYSHAHFWPTPLYIIHRTRRYVLCDIFCTPASVHCERVVNTWHPAHLLRITLCVEGERERKNVTRQCEIFQHIVSGYDFKILQSLGYGRRFQLCEVGKKKLEFSQPEFLTMARGPRGRETWLCIVRKYATYLGHKNQFHQVMLRVFILARRDGALSYFYIDAPIERKKGG